MEVRGGRGALLCALIFLCSGCFEDDSNEQTFPRVTGACETTAFRDQFIVQWKDGSITREYASDRESFIKEILEPHRSEILFVENDQLVQRTRPHLATFRLQDESPELMHWGQEMILAPDVWDMGYEGKDVMVAVIDSGIDVKHPELINQIAYNQSEIPGNNLDDDNNGLVDDYAGYDFATDSGILSDTTGHGTHVTGIIAAEHGVGEVYGVAPRAKILPLAFIGPEGAGSISDAISAIAYARDRGAKIINASWGGPACSQTLSEVIRGLSEDGILFISAAGNSGLDIDVYPEYPAAFQLDTQISVGASTPRDFTAGFSNTGYEAVHLVAPGVEIYSTYSPQLTESLSGTSMATPFVSGAAAVLWSLNPDATASEIKGLLLETVDAGPFPVRTQGRLNLLRAVNRSLKP